MRDRDDSAEERHIHGNHRVLYITTDQSLALYPTTTTTTLNIVIDHGKQYSPA